MKQAYKLVVLAIVATLTMACYKDKGNYDYKDINEITISIGSYDQELQNVSLGGLPITVTPKIRFVNGQGDMSRLSYKWYLIPDNNKPEEGLYTQDDWNTLNFNWTPTFLVPLGVLYLEVTDSQTGIVYINSDVSIKVTSRYDSEGAMILAEKDGKTQFSFIKITEKVSLLPTKFEVYNNVYNMENGGDLPNGAIKIHEHFCKDGSTIGQLLLLTENGAYDINGKDFKKEIDLTAAFDGQAYPANFGYAKDAMFMAGVDLVTDSEGHLYSRVKNTKELFHSGSFLHNRLKIEGEAKELVGCRPLLAPFKDLRACTVYEESRKRFLVVADQGTSAGNGKPEAENASRPVALANPTNTAPEGFLPIDNLGDEAEIIWIGHFRVTTTGSKMGYTIVFYKDGKTYCQEFVVEKDYYTMKYTVTTPTIAEIQGLPGKPTLAYGASYGYGNPLLFCAVGKDLYVFDRKNPGVKAVKFEPKDPQGKPLSDVFSGDIVTLDAENYYSRWLAVGLSDGRALIIKGIQSNYPVDQVVFYDSKDYSYGKIKDFRFKINRSNGWEM